jgi:hypothetical protein
LPRLGSWVRIPSPAPNFLQGNQSVMTGPPRGDPSLYVLTFWRSKKCKHYVSSSAKAGCGLGVLWRAYEAGSKAAWMAAITALPPPRRFPTLCWTLAGPVQILSVQLKRRLSGGRNAQDRPLTTILLRGLATPDSRAWLSPPFRDWQRKPDRCPPKADVKCVSFVRDYRKAQKNSSLNVPQQDAPARKFSA